MITNSRLGYTGQLGNQMYQFGFLYVLAKKHGYQIKIPIRNTIEFNVAFHRLELFSIFNLNPAYLTSEVLNPTHVINKWGVVHFTDAFEIPDDSDIRGNFQSSNYFLPYRKELMDLYQFQPRIQSRCDQFRQTLDVTKEIVGIHVRRGDYVDLHNALEKEYYLNHICLNFSSEQYQIVCVSDDIPWCKANLPGLNYFSISAGDDMCFLTKCQHLICSNSTFSWWSAFLNPNKGKVLMPVNWFSEKYKQFWGGQYDETIFFY